MSDGPDPTRDYFPAAKIDLILLDAHILMQGATPPPEGAETLAEAVRRLTA